MAGLFEVVVPDAPFVRMAPGPPAPGLHRLTANAPAGISPVLWRSPDLVHWSPVPDFLLETTNSTFRVTDPAPPAGPNLYQMRW
ncbi:MAG: hypothetical protein KF791_02440 [Verrucomicrobiae bacterium]|nr:hypothetical protein [Verrucomicrobiae bacterium]